MTNGDASFFVGHDMTRSLSLLISMTCHVTPRWSSQTESASSHVRKPLLSTFSNCHTHDQIEYHITVQILLSRGLDTLRHVHRVTNSSQIWVACHVQIHLTINLIPLTCHVRLRVPHLIEACHTMTRDFQKSLTCHVLQHHYGLA